MSSASSEYMIAYLFCVIGGIKKESLDINFCNYIVEINNVAP